MGYIAIPIPVDRLTPADYAERIHSSQIVLAHDWRGNYQLVAATDLHAFDVSAFSDWAPLYVGRMAELPAVRALNKSESEFTLEIDEQSPWAFRIAPAPCADTSTDTWPAILDANWRELPEDTVINNITGDRVGAGRIVAIDGLEGEPRRSQKQTIPYTC